MMLNHPYRNHDKIKVKVENEKDKKLEKFANSSTVNNRIKTEDIVQTIGKVVIFLRTIHHLFFEPYVLFDHTLLRKVNLCLVSESNFCLEPYRVRDTIQ